MLIWQVIILVFFSFILIKSAEWIIVSLRRIAKRSKVGVFAISAIILAVGTSLPELFVGITSAIEGTPNISLGVVLGSNIANTALITGLVALILGKINVHGDYLKRDVFVALCLYDFKKPADIAKKTPNARSWDDKMSKARADLNWEEMFKLAIDTDKAKKIREQCGVKDLDACSMCGKFCSVKLNKEFRK